MKKVLLASTALIFVGGMAMAEVSVGGDGRMGIIGGGNNTDNSVVDAGVDGILGTADDVVVTPDDGIDESDPTFTSRIRISFSASGETDGGLSFGGSIRADNAAGGAAGTAGSVFAEGAFGKISMGDVDGAAEAAVGDVSGVGLTGLGDYNEMTYLSNPDLPAVLYEYSTGDLSFYASADRPNVSDNEAYAVGASYGFGNFTVALGYESLDNGTDSVDHIIGGVTAAFGDATVKAIYGSASDVGDEDQWGVSMDYVFGATTVTAFYRDDFNDENQYGVGAAYDLGGGASLVGGYVDSDELDSGLYDFGLKMSF